VDPDVIHPEILEHYYRLHRVYNPAADRQSHFYSSSFPLRDVKADEELFDNYVAMSGRSLAYWNESISELKAQCNGEDVGIIREYETLKEYDNVGKGGVVVSESHTLQGEPQLEIAMISEHISASGL
jgi:hypothetical protein